VDRRVQRVRPALRPLGEARPDLAIFQSLAQEMGANLGPSTAKEANDEIRNLVPLYGGITYARLDLPEYPAGIQWPCPSPIIRERLSFTRRNSPGKARLIFTEYEEEMGKNGFLLRSGHGPPCSTPAPFPSRARG